MNRENTNTAIITVVGRDKVGIIAAVSAFLTERGINIEDISQTILSGNFVMMMSVDTGSAAASLADINAELQQVGEKLGVSVSMMHEKVFGAMHRI
ncbi:MAG: ACT domain-containing protein [Spirochaetaceae bacterium]|jgi:ACT domain-containing protein|nr:ACT domain-containing protein [Spirochaetaceae bacterium]